MKRYFKNIDISILYRYIDNTSWLTRLATRLILWAVSCTLFNRGSLSHTLSTHFESLYTNMYPTGSSDGAMSRHPLRLKIHRATPVCYKFIISRIIPFVFVSNYTVARTKFANFFPSYNDTMGWSQLTPFSDIMSNCFRAYISIISKREEFCSLFMAKFLSIIKKKKKGSPSDQSTSKMKGQLYAFTAEEPFLNLSWNLCKRFQWSYLHFRKGYYQNLNFFCIN